MNNQAQKTRRSSVWYLFTAVFALLIFPVGLLAQDYAVSRAYQEDPASETFSKSKAGAAHAKRVYGDIEIQQKQLILSQTLDIFLSSGKETTGTPFFHGKYAHKDQWQWLGAPSDIWLQKAPDGSLTAITQVSCLNYAIVATGNDKNQITDYKIGATKSDGLSAYQIEYEFRDGIALRLAKTPDENYLVEGMTLPESAIFDPNSPRDPFTAANIFLRGFEIEESGDSFGTRAFDIDASGEKFVDYALTIKHLGKENVAVPAGTFNVNHIEVRLMTAAEGEYERRVGRVVDFWTLDNGVIVLIQRRHENYEVQLVEYTAPEPLEGIVEDAMTTAKPLAPGVLIEIDVPAVSPENAGWISTGYSVSEGDTISFRGEGFVITDPDSLANGPNGVEQDNAEQKVPLIASHTRMGALIGKIGNTKQPSVVFTIGESSDYLTTQSGVLFLAVNDRFGKFDDNMESFRATFIIGDLPARSPSGLIGTNTQNNTAETINKEEITKQILQKKPLLEYIGSISSEDFTRVASVAISPDGRHAYTASWEANTLCAFVRNVENGYLTHVQTIKEPTYMTGVIGARVSPDGRYVGAASSKSGSLVLFQRDIETGLLKEVDKVQDGLNGLKYFACVLDLAFSPDSQFVYVISNRSGAVMTFKILKSGKLEYVYTDRPIYDPNAITGNLCLFGARGIAMSPGGESIYVAADMTGNLVALDRDAITGKTNVRQIIRDGEGGATGLAGAFGVSCSPDGKQVFASSGRFRGDHAVSVFDVAKDGTLSITQEIRGESEGNLLFSGGNEITATADGQYVFAAGSKSNSILCFQRDQQTGRLTWKQTLSHKSMEHGSLKMPAGITASPDSRFLYVGVENDKAISAFKLNF